MPTPPLLFILGTRSEAIRAIPVFRALESRHPKLRVRKAATGQHSMLFHQIIEIEGVRFDHNLEAMAPRQVINRLLGRMIADLEPVVRNEEPIAVVTIGDSASTTAAAIAARLGQIPVAHIEAGLRGAAPAMPYPQTDFRRMIASIADLHLAPTRTARFNLTREAVPEDRIRVVGDPALEAFLAAFDQPHSIEDPQLTRVDPSKRIVLATLSRRESHNEPTHRFCESIRQLAERNPDTQFLIVHHLNIHIMEPMRNLLPETPNLIQTSPLPHALFVNLLRLADLAVTDSGGVFQEASWLGLPVVLLQAVPDTGRLLGSNEIVQKSRHEPDSLVPDVERAMNAHPIRNKPAQPQPDCESGAADRIADALAAWVDEKSA